MNRKSWRRGYHGTHLNGDAMPFPLTRSCLLLLSLLLFGGCGGKETASTPSSTPTPAKSAPAVPPSAPPKLAVAEEEDPNETKAFELHEKWKKAFEFNVTAAEDRAGAGQAGEFRGLTNDRAVEVVEGAISKTEAVMAEVKAQPPVVQELFFSLLAGQGIKDVLMSSDGSRVTFVYNGGLYDSTDTDNLPDVYLWNLSDGTVRRASQGGKVDGKWPCNSPTLSKDGSIVAFSNGGSFLGPEMPPEQHNIYIRDLAAGGDPVAVADNPDWTPEGDFKLPTGMGRILQHPSLSADGNKLVFVASVASSRAIEDMVGPTYEAVVLLDRTTKKYRALSQKVNRLGRPVISGDGSTVAIFGPPAGFLPDAKDQTTCNLWLVPTDGSAATQVPNPEGVTIYPGHFVPPSISADGNRVAIATVETAGIKPQVYLYDRATSQWTLVSANPAGKPGSDKSVEPSISADGSAVAFVSYADDLLGGKTLGAQTYRYDVATKQLSVMTVNGEGNPCQGVSAVPSLNADGSRAAVLASASDLPGVRVPKRKTTGVLMRLYVVDPKEKRYVPLGKALNP